MANKRDKKDREVDRMELRESKTFTHISKTQQDEESDSANNLSLAERGKQENYGGGLQ